MRSDHWTREEGKPDWLSVLLHSMIGLILGGIWGAQLSSVIDRHLSASAIPVAVGGALAVAGIGAYVQYYLYATPLSVVFLATATKGKLGFPAHNRASRLFAAMLFGMGVVTLIAGMVWRYLQSF